MKLASIFFTASESILEVYLKNTNNKSEKYKVYLVFFAASESILEVYLKNTNNKSEKYKVYLVFFAASESILLFCGRIGNKARMQ